ncbi:MAG: hypothetical protein H0U85_07075 [Gemmatimonadales bacterium]|nr:hypothetical protein [Gemmatimonadales bacterium]
MTATPDNSASSAATQLLVAGVRAGNRDAFDRLFAQLYDELRRIAHARLLHQSPGETLTTTALVHEAYVKLVGHAGLEWSDRAHFLALASRAMRFVLVDYARAQGAAKLGGRCPGALARRAQGRRRRARRDSPSSSAG